MTNCSRRSVLRGSAPSNAASNAMAAAGLFGGAGLAKLASETDDQATADVSAAQQLLASCKNSFSASTPVLMADGTTKPIEQIKVGDKILNAEPGDAKTSAHVVTALHVTTDHEFADLTVLTAKGDNTLHTTKHHPFFDASTGKWTDAGELKARDLLDTPGDGHVVVVAVRQFSGAGTMYNLTIDGLHTYYVVAGNTPVLVHNSDCGITYLYRVAQKDNGSSELKHGLDPKNFPLDDESDGSAYFGNESRTTDFSAYHQDSHELAGYRVAVPTQWLEQHGIEAYEGMTRISHTSGPI